MSIGELYGEQNTLNGEWKDGLAACLIREAVSAANNDHKWIIFDGPVDAIWIENMNTVSRGKSQQPGNQVSYAFTDVAGLVWSPCALLKVDTLLPAFSIQAWTSI